MFRLVIADDERIMRKGLQSLDWKSHEIEIIGVASNGIETQELIDSCEFDILLSDIRMPGMNGIELAKNLYEANPSAKTILLTGYGEFSYAQQAIAVGVFDYLLKPSTPDIIFECVERACKKILEERGKKKKLEQLEQKLEGYQQVVGVDMAVNNESSQTEIQDILKYIYAEYARPLTLSMLADHFHFSTVYLSMYIKKYTGHTFLEILTSVRMFHAAQYLKETKMKNSEIGYRIGLYDERYFGQIFKKTFGMTPYEFRKNHDGRKWTLDELMRKDKKNEKKYFKE